MLRWVWAVLVCMAAQAAFTGEDADPTVKVGEVAPPIEGKVWVTPDGKNPDLKSKVYLVDFWFANCASCVEAMPKLKELAAKYAPKGFILVGLSTDPLSIVQEMKDKHKLTYPLLSDSVPSVEAWKVEFFPSMFLVGKDGKIAWKGVSEDDKLIPAIEAALAK